MMSKTNNEIKKAKHWVVIAKNDNYHEVLYYRKSLINKVSNRTINKLLSSGLFELKNDVLILKPIYECNAFKLGEKYILDIWLFASDLEKYVNVKICGEVENDFVILIENTNKKLATEFNKDLVKLLETLSPIYKFAINIDLFNDNNQIKIKLTRS